MRHECEQRLQPIELPFENIRAIAIVTLASSLPPEDISARRKRNMEKRARSARDALKVEFGDEMVVEDKMVLEEEVKLELEVLRKVVVVDCVGPLTCVS